MKNAGARSAFPSRIGGEAQKLSRIGDIERRETHLPRKLVTRITRVHSPVSEFPPWEGRSVRVAFRSSRFGRVRPVPPTEPGSTMLLARRGPSSTRAWRANRAAHGAPRPGPPTSERLLVVRPQFGLRAAEGSPGRFQGRRQLAGLPHLEEPAQAAQRRKATARIQSSGFRPRRSGAVRGSASGEHLGLLGRSNCTSRGCLVGHA